ncbi:MAG: family 20 glycosylhydrolase [Kiritimatiellae bacterium]|nr:family 20 glycosylhydrolase [Kiritimatiellia bacterium]
MRRRTAIPGLCAIGVAIALVGCGTSQFAPCGATALDDLMPGPKRIVTSVDRTVPVARLSNITVMRGAVSEAPPAVADEAYVLDIGEDGAKITASGMFGEIWARVTLDQIVRLADGGDVPFCRITDWPRLKWRGFMLDSVRNYLPPQGVKDVIDVMSRYKLNLFHWHLTENYAWRLESKRFPELQSERAFLHRHKGKFYTQDEFKEIVDYAYARGVRVMPEFDFPGHALAFRRAFGFKTMSDFGVAEKAAALFEELCTLAPKEKMPFIHMGTDEVFNREVEGAQRETLERMAKSIADAGRTVVSWVPGETYDSPGPRINMLWTDKVSPDRNPGAYFDAIGMYIEDFDPFELLSVAVYHKAARWHDAGDLNQGAIFCAWHDGFVGLPYENLLRNQPVFPACVLFGDAYWHGCDSDLPQFRKHLPRGGDPLLGEAAEIERRVVAQRDRALRGLKHPFHFLRQTDMRWRLTQSDGTLIAEDIAQATISPGRIMGADGKPLLSPSNGTVVAETWIKSPKDQKVGAWIGFTNISRDHGMVYSAPLPGIGEWNRFGATVELNGEKVEPPKWKRPGLKKGSPIADWTPAWTLYEADEEPFTDQEYVMREPTPICLRKGWNHVKLTMPNPAAKEKTRHRWVATFIPVAGTTDHPHEVPGLEYSSEKGE